MPVICPTCQMHFSEMANRPDPATLHGVVFNIFGRVSPGRSSRGMSRPLIISPPSPSGNAGACPAHVPGLRHACHPGHSVV